jgi:hypothetical protein
MEKIRNSLNSQLRTLVISEQRVFRTGAMSSKPSLLLLPLLLSATALCRADPESVQDFCVAAPHGEGGGGLPCKPSSAVVSDDFFFARTTRWGPA